MGVLDSIWVDLEYYQINTIPRRHLLSEGGSLSAGEETFYIILCIVLVIFSGICAGLLLGLLSLDRLDLEVIKHSGTAKEKKLVARVEPLIKNPHFLLVSLIFWNAIAFEALPIFLDRLLNPIAAIAISVTAILIFGEIVPQALCKRYGLQIGAHLSWFVRLLMILAFPVSWPMSKILDSVLGHESVLFRRHELKALVSLHGDSRINNEDRTSSLGRSSSAKNIIEGANVLSPDEVQVIVGALDLAHKTAQQIMTPIEHVFLLSADDVINRELLEKIIERGHSRVPVYKNHPTNIVGLILVKELVLVDETAGFTVQQCGIREIPRLRGNVPLYAALKMFRGGRSHMALLTKAKEDVSTRSTLTATPPPLEVDSSGARPSIQPLLPAGEVVIPINETPAPPTSAFSANGAQNRVSVSAVDDDLIGIITIEDVIEELLQIEILDETDKFVDNLQTEPRGLGGNKRQALKFLTKKPVSQQAATPPQDTTSNNVTTIPQQQQGTTTNNKDYYEVKLDVKSRTDSTGLQTTTVGSGLLGAGGVVTTTTAAAAAQAAGRSSTFTPGSSPMKPPGFKSSAAGSSSTSLRPASSKTLDEMDKGQ